MDVSLILQLIVLLLEGVVIFVILFHLRRLSIHTEALDRHIESLDNHLRELDSHTKRVEDSTRKLLLNLTQKLRKGVRTPRRARPKRSL